MRPVTYRDGILGVHCTTTTKENTIEELDDDYSERMRDSIESTVEKLFCSNGEVDTMSAKKVFAKVHTFLGDGAASVQKCGALLRAGRCKKHRLDPARSRARDEDVHGGASEEAWRLPKLLGRRVRS